MTPAGEPYRTDNGSPNQTDAKRVGKKSKKKNEGKALVKQAARDLGLEYQKGMRLGDLIQSEADRIVKQVAVSKSVDPDGDDSWRGITRSRRDLYPVQQYRMIEIANYIARQNLLGAHISKIKRDFIIGDGIKYEAEDKTVIQGLLDDFWCDPVNNMDEYQFELVEYLGINGELFIPTFTNDVSGVVKLGWIEPVEVDQVVADRLNRRIMREVIMRPGAGAGTSSYYDLSVRKTYSIINVDTNPSSRFYNSRVGDLHFFKVNAAPDGTRGRSDFEPLADHIDAWDQAVWNDIEKSELVKRFIWDVLLTGYNEAQIEEWLRKQTEPAPGSIRAHNESCEWNAVAPDLKIQESRVHTVGLRNDALGGAGLSPFFFGDTESANKASSENLDTPILAGFKSRQRKIRAIFKEMGDNVIDQAALRRPALKRQIESGRISRKLDVVMPELATKDMSRVGSVVSQITSALDLAVERQWITSEKAATIFGAFMAQFGVEYDAQKEMEEAAKEHSENEPDYKPEKVANFNRRLAAASKR